MKRIISQLRFILEMMVWDLLTVAAFLILLIVTVSYVKEPLMKVLLAVGASVFIFLMLFFKCRLLSRGAKIKRRLSGQRRH